MWLSREIENLGQLVTDDKTLKDFLNQTEREAINENSTRFVNLKSSLLIPKHNKPVN